MSINDQDITLRPGASNDVWPGSMNPTSRNQGGDVTKSNFIDDPTTDERGAGAPSDFTGDRMAKKALNAEAGVVEGFPGILETTNVHPLREDSNKDDGWANATIEPGSGNSTTTTNTTGSVLDSASEMANSASAMATGAAKAAYGTATGNTQMANEGKAAVFGESEQ